MCHNVHMYQMWKMVVVVLACVSVCLHACAHGASKPLRKREDKRQNGNRKKRWYTGCL